MQTQENLKLKPGELIENSLMESLHHAIGLRMECVVVLCLIPSREQMAVHKEKVNWILFHLWWLQERRNPSLKKVFGFCKVSDLNSGSDNYLQVQINCPRFIFQIIQLKLKKGRSSIFTSFCHVMPLPQRGLTEWMGKRCRPPHIIEGCPRPWKN